MKRLRDNVSVVLSLAILLLTGAHLKGDPETGGAKVRTVAEQVRSAMCPSARPESFCITHVDSEPSVAVGELRGFRIVVSKRVLKFLPDPNPSPTRMPPSTNVTEFIEIVLFPTGERPATNLAARIPWSEFVSMYHLQSADMGTGFGFHWFGRMNLWEQDDLRERIGLEGGENRADLAVEGLSVRDEGTMTANSMVCRMSRFGEDGVRAVSTALAAKRSPDPWYIILGLSSVSNVAAASLLTNLYDSAEQRVSHAAAYALINKPYRREARRVYLDMLQRNVHDYGLSAAEACAEYGWREAIPVLQQNFERATGWQKKRLGELIIKLKN